MRTTARRVKHRFLNWFNPTRKSDAELEFWRQEIVKYQHWFNGDLKSLYGVPSPDPSQKVTAPNLKDASVLTLHKLLCEVKYLENLDLSREAFCGKRVLDVGAGPMPGGTCFKQIQLYSLDPLVPDYVRAGYPIHYYHDVHFVHASSENMPLSDGFIDVVIAVNSIDHVDDIRRTAMEIQRVLKTGGWLRMQVHYHRATVTEPLELNDEKIAGLFAWCANFRKIKESSEAKGIALPPNEKFALWSNF
jgi:SAM-dependent methyltransferase